MIDEMFEGRALSFVLQVPGPILSASSGAQVSVDRRTLTYSARMRDLVSLGEDLVLSVTW